MIRTRWRFAELTRLHVKQRIVEVRVIIYYYLKNYQTSKNCFLDSKENNDPTQPAADDPSGNSAMSITHGNFKFLN